jgi:hypothetical protein
MTFEKASITKRHDQKVFILSTLFQSLKRVSSFRRDFSFGCPCRINRHANGVSRHFSEKQVFAQEGGK